MNECEWESMCFYNGEIVKDLEVVFEVEEIKDQWKVRIYSIYIEKRVKLRQVVVIVVAAAAACGVVYVM